MPMQKHSQGEAKRKEGDADRPVAPFALVVALLVWTPSARAQGSPWAGPYTWFSPQTSGEYEHAAAVGATGPHQGKVFIVRTSIADGLFLWDPAAPTALELYPYDNYLDNLACCGHSWDGDGDLIMAGGDKNTACGPEPLWSHVYRPAEGWTVFTTPPMLGPIPFPAPPLRYGYYYPTTVALHDGRVTSIGGTAGPWRTQQCGPEPPNTFLAADNWQFFDKTSLRWEGQTLGAANDQPFSGMPGSPSFGQYPRVSLLSTGDLFCSVQAFGSVDVVQNRFASCSASASVTSWPPSAWSVHPSQLRDAQGVTVNLYYACAVQWPYRIDASGVVPWDTGGWVDRTLVLGGFDDQDGDLTTPFNSVDRQAKNTTWQITNPLGAGATWVIPTSYGAMARRRTHANVVLTPDLKLIVFGGSQNEYCAYDSGGTQVQPIPVYEPEILDLLNPAAGWQLLTPHASPRLYHSIALLLKDGRILIGSGYKATIPLPPDPLALVHTDAEVFTPPCLQQGLARPTIVNAQDQIENLQYGVSIPTLGISLQGSNNPATEIEFATLIRCGTATHHFDPDQRCIKLEVTGATGRHLQLAPIPSQQQGGHFVVPPGWYYLFVVTTPRGNPLVRVPSVARFVHVH